MGGGFALGNSARKSSITLLSAVWRGQPQSGPSREYVAEHMCCCLLSNENAGSFICNGVADRFRVRMSHCLAATLKSDAMLWVGVCHRSKALVVLHSRGLAQASPDTKACARHEATRTEPGTSAPVHRCFKNLKTPRMTLKCRLGPRCPGCVAWTLKMLLMQPFRDTTNTLRASFRTYVV